MNIVLLCLLAVFCVTKCNKLSPPGCKIPSSCPIMSSGSTYGTADCTLKAVTEDNYLISTYIAHETITIRLECTLNAQAHLEEGKIRGFLVMANDKPSFVQSESSAGIFNANNLPPHTRLECDSHGVAHNCSSDPCWLGQSQQVQHTPPVVSQSLDFEWTAPSEGLGGVYFRAIVVNSLQQWWGALTPIQLKLPEFILLTQPRPTTELGVERWEIVYTGYFSARSACALYNELDTADITEGVTRTMRMLLASGVRDVCQLEILFKECDRDTQQVAFKLVAHEVTDEQDYNLDVVLTSDFARALMKGTVQLNHPPTKKLVTITSTEQCYTEEGWDEEGEVDADVFHNQFTGQFVQELEDDTTCKPLKRKTDCEQIPTCAWDTLRRLCAVQLVVNNPTPPKTEETQQPPSVTHDDSTNTTNSTVNIITPNSPKKGHQTFYIVISMCALVILLLLLVVISVVWCKRQGKRGYQDAFDDTPQPPIDAKGTTLSEDELYQMQTNKQSWQDDLCKLLSEIGTPTDLFSVVAPFGEPARNMMMAITGGAPSTKGTTEAEEHTNRDSQEHKDNSDDSDVSQPDAESATHKVCQQTEVDIITFFIEGSHMCDVLLSPTVDLMCTEMEPHWPFLKLLLMSLESRAKKTSVEEAKATLTLSDASLFDEGCTLTWCGFLPCAVRQQQQHEEEMEKDGEVTHLPSGENVYTLTLRLCKGYQLSNICLNKPTLQNVMVIPPMTKWTVSKHAGNNIVMRMVKCGVFMTNHNLDPSGPPLPKLVQRLDFTTPSKQ